MPFHLLILTNEPKEIFRDVDKYFCTGLYKDFCTGLDKIHSFVFLPWFPSFHLLPYLYDCSGFLLLLVKCFWLNACHLGPLWRIFWPFFFNSILALFQPYDTNLLVYFNQYSSRKGDKNSLYKHTLHFLPFSTHCI